MFHQFDVIGYAAVYEVGSCAAMQLWKLFSLRRQDIAFLVREELLDRVRLLDIRHEPVPDSRPGGVGVAAEHELPARRVDLQELRPVGVPAERRMDDHPRRDLVPAVDDLRLAAEDLAQDLLHRLRRIAADRAPRAGLRRRSDLLRR